jgi:hypothetical protein
MKNIIQTFPFVATVEFACKIERRIYLCTIPERISRQYLDDWGDELNEEPWNFEQRGVKMVDEVHDKTLDMRSVLILICHDHDVTVA